MTSAGHHSMMQSAASWKNPYITDGLIAMYDGIWNAGPELHDANTLTWKNLGSLGSAFDATRPQGTFDADGASIVRTTTSAANVFSIPGYLLRDHMKGEWSYEIGFTPIGTGWRTNYAGLWGSHGEGLGKGMSGGQYVNGYMNFILYPPNTFLFRPHYSVFSAGTKYAITQTASNNSGSSVTYKDGVVAETVTSVNVLITWNLPETYIGSAAGYDPGRVWNGTIHFLRIYNRQITAAEVAFNRAIDISRYNLPH